MARKPKLEPLNWTNVERLSIDRQTGALYWDGRQVVTRSWVRLGKFERWMIALVAAGTFGAFLIEVWKLISPMMPWE